MSSMFQKSVVVVSLLALAGCGSSSSTSTTTTTAAIQVTSLSSIPEIKSMFSSSSASSSQSRSLMRALVSGTPTALSGINGENSDEIFWGGLLTDLSNDSVDPSDQEVQNQFFQGMATCRMAENVGYAMQNISQSGTSLCYMKNMSEVPSAISLVSGSALEANELVNQAENTKTVKINVTEPEGEGGGGGGGGGGEDEEGAEGSQTIFIRVHGSNSTTGSAGYAADLWFCSPETNEINGAEQIRVNKDTGALTHTSVQKNGGGRYFINQFAAVLSKTADGTYEFSADDARTAEFFNEDSYGTFKSSVSVTGDELINKNYSNFSFDDKENTNKTYVVSQVGVNTSGDILFYQGGLKNSFGFNDDSNEFSIGTEFQSGSYVALESGDYYDLANTFDMEADAFYSSLTADATLLASLSSFSCTETVDTEMNLDMNTEAMDEVVEECESDWQSMDFCRNETIREIENEIFSARP